MRDNPETFRDRVHLATWVAGVAPTAIELPATGTASFSGHNIGNVINNGAKYVAAGTYTQSWDFASRTGAATISGFDTVGSGIRGGIATSTAIASVPGAVVFGGSISDVAVSTPGFSAAISGSFFKDATAVSGVGVGGAFVLGSNSGTYTATGTFAAKQTGLAP